MYKRQCFVRHPEAKRHPLLLSQGVKQLRCLQQQGVEVYRFGANRPGFGITARQNQQIVNESRHAGALLFDIGDELGRLGFAGVQGGGAGADDGQGGTELMGGRGNELVLTPGVLLDGTEGLAGEIPAEEPEKDDP